MFFGGQLYYDKRNIERSFKDSQVDYILLGEGDITVCELVMAIYQNGNVNNCDGLCYKDGNETIYTKPRKMLKNLDNLPYLDFTDMSLDDYDDNEHLPLQTSRGCVWACKFCSTHSFWPGYRQMCAERIHQKRLRPRRQPPEKPRRWWILERTHRAYPRHPLIRKGVL